MKKFDIYVSEGPQSKQLRFTIESIIREQGGRIAGVGLTPEGLNIFGSAPEPVVSFLEGKSKEFDFRVERNGETLKSLIEEASHEPE